MEEPGGPPPLVVPDDGPKVRQRPARSKDSFFPCAG